MTEVQNHQAKAIKKTFSHLVAKADQVGKQESDDEEYGGPVDTNYLASSEKKTKKSHSRYVVHTAAELEEIKKDEDDSDNEDYGGPVDTHYLDPSEKKIKKSLSRYIVHKEEFEANLKKNDGDSDEEYGDINPNEFGVVVKKSLSKHAAAGDVKIRPTIEQAAHMDASDEEYGDVDKNYLQKRALKNTFPHELPKDKEDSDEEFDSKKDTLDRVHVDASAPKLNQAAAQEKEQSMAVTTTTACVVLPPAQPGSPRANLRRVSSVDKSKAAAGIAETENSNNDNNNKNGDSSTSKEGYSVYDYPGEAQEVEKLIAQGYSRQQAEGYRLLSLYERGLLYSEGSVRAKSVSMQRRKDENSFSLPFWKKSNQANTSSSAKRFPDRKESKSRENEDSSSSLVQRISKTLSRSSSNQNVKESPPRSISPHSLSRSKSSSPALHIGDMYGVKDTRLPQPGEEEQKGLSKNDGKDSKTLTFVVPENATSDSRINSPSGPEPVKDWHRTFHWQLGKRPLQQPTPTDPLIVALLARGYGLQQAIQIAVTLPPIRPPSPPPPTVGNVVSTEQNHFFLPPKRKGLHRVVSLHKMAHVPPSLDASSMSSASFFSLSPKMSAEESEYQAKLDKLLADQQAEFGTNMHRSLKDDDEQHLLELLQQGCSLDEASFVIFNEKVGDGRIRANNDSSVTIHSSSNEKIVRIREQELKKNSNSFILSLFPKKEGDSS